MSFDKILKAVGDADFKFKLNEPMAKHTSFGIGGPADIFIELKSVERAAELLLIIKQFNVPYTIIGNGSNLLVSDKGIEGVVVKICDDTLEIKGDVCYCAAGVKLSAFCLKVAEASLGGAEFAYGIPGTVGGAVFMNAGAYGGEIKQIIESVKSLDKNGKVTVRTKNELELGYRTSIFKTNGEIILSATFKLNKREKSEIIADMDDFLTRRKSKQPIELPSAGSTFKRPEGNFAGTLIEQCGLKGVSIGGAEVSIKHAGFIVNNGGATALDVLTLIKKVQDTVYSEFGIMLEPEVIFKGR